MKPSQPLFQPFLESHSFGSSSRNKPVIRRPARRHPFLWAFITTFNLFIAVAVWAGIATLTAQPERRFCYELLGKLGKREALVTFGKGSEAGLPASEHFSVSDIYQRYGAFSGNQLDALNNQLLRNYITNYEKSGPIPLLEGEFEFYDIRRLSHDNVFPDGLVLLARSTATNAPPIYLEYLLPTPAGQSVDIARLGLQENSSGQIIAPEGLPKLELERGRQLATIAHVAKRPDDSLLFSVIPLSYEAPDFGKNRSLTLAPPAALNLQSELPVIAPADTMTGTDEDAGSVATTIRY